MKRMINKLIVIITKTMVNSRFTWPLVLVYSKIVIEIRPKNKKTPSGKPTLLALNPERFRGDLEILADSGKFRVLKIPLDWQNRLLGLYSEKINSYLPKKLKGRKVIYFNPEGNSELIENKTLLKIINQQTRLRSFLKIFLKAFYKKMEINGVIGAGVHFKQDYDWGLVSNNIGVPYIVMHRENLYTVPELQKIKVNEYEKYNKFVGDHIIVQNKISEDIFMESGYVDSEKISAIGSLRMDGFVRKTKSVKYAKPTIKNKLKVVLFSFHYGAAIWNKVGIGFKNRSNGYVKMFEHVHVSFAKLAMQNSDVDFVIKPKWGGPWIDEIEYVFRKNNIDSSEVDNLSILVDCNVHELIHEADVVCGFSSTVLLEAAITGIPVIVPCFDEALKPEYAENIQFKEELDIFDVAHSIDDFENLIIEKLEKPTRVGKDLLQERYAVFEKYVSSMNGDALDKYVNTINKVIKESQCA